jgi:hypothetical protein
MREFKLLVGYILVIIGFVSMIAANLTAIGIGLYDWAFNTTLALAAWGAFVLWLKMMGGGILAIAIGAILGEGNLTYKK